MFLRNGKGSLIRLIAGLFIVVSVILSVYVNHYWLIFTGLVGIMLMISSLTGFCPMEIILKSCGIKEKSCCNNN